MLRASHLLRRKTSPGEGIHSNEANAPSSIHGNINASTVNNITSTTSLLVAPTTTGTILYTGSIVPPIPSVRRSISGESEGLNVFLGNPGSSSGEEDGQERSGHTSREDLEETRSLLASSSTTTALSSILDSSSSSGMSNGTHGNVRHGMLGGGKLTRRLSDKTGSSFFSSGTSFASSKWNVFLQHAIVWLRESLVLPLMCMYFVMLLINTLLRDTKDTMLVNSVASVSAIPILKTWATIPTSFCFLFAYSRLAHSGWSQRTQFIVVVSCFALFYVAFAVALYPNKRSISPVKWASGLRADSSRHPTLATFASVAEEWVLGLFYVVSELWSSAVCQLLFWSVANDVMTIRLAKEQYPLIGAMGNSGLVVAGRLLVVLADRRDVDRARAYLQLHPHETSNTQYYNNSVPFERTSKFSQANNAPVRLAREFDKAVEQSFFFGENLEPAERGWMGTLVGIALLLFFGVVFIIVCYDDLYRRLALFHPEVAGRRLQRIYDEQKLSRVTHQQLTQQTNNNGPIATKNSGPDDDDYDEDEDLIANEIDLENTRRLNESNEIKRGNGVGGSSSNGPTTTTAVNTVNNAGGTKPKIRVSTFEALKTLSHSQHLRLVAVLVASYGISSSLIEVSWKSQVKRAFPDVGEYSRFMANFWTWTGVSSMLCMLLSRSMLRRLGYRVAVVFTPLAMMVAGGVFFSVAVAVALHIGFVQATDDILAIAAYAGGLAVLVAKSAKYAVFDATKEMVFIPLDKDSRGVGKAAVDVVAYRLSKSGGAVVLQLVILTFGHLEDTGLLPIAVVFVVVVVGWLRAALATGQLMHEAQRVEAHHNTAS